jgi:mannose-6-phosphate isomerase-like protein (cupin superfamily)
MEKVSLDDLTATAPPDENVPEGALASSIGDVRQLTDALGVTGFSFNHFELAPGDSSAHSMHRHPEQEEVFYVLDGTVTVERPAGEPDVEVDADEVVRVPPDTSQFVVNRGEEPATMLAFGAPREYQAEGRYLMTCSTCGERTEQTFGLEEGTGDGPTAETASRAIVCECLECGEESHRKPV